MNWLLVCVGHTRYMIIKVSSIDVLAPFGTISQVHWIRSKDTKLQNSFKSSSYMYQMCNKLVYTCIGFILHDEIFEKEFFSMFFIYFNGYVQVVVRR